MPNFNDFMSQMRGGQPGGFSGMGQQAQPGQPFGGMLTAPQKGQMPRANDPFRRLPMPMPGQRPGGPISTLPMPPGMGGGMSQDQKQADYQRFVQNQQMNGAPVMSMDQWSAASAPTQQQAQQMMGQGPTGGMPPGMNPQFMQQGQALDAARQAALQGMPAFQQLQQLSGQFKMGGQPTPEQAAQMQQLTQQLNTNPTLLGLNEKMQALSTQYGMNGMGKPPPPGMTGLGGGMPPAGLTNLGQLGGMGQLGNLPQGMNGGVPQPQQLGAGLPAGVPPQGALNALQAQPPVGGAPQSAMAGQAAAPVMGGLGQMAAMSSPTAPVKGAALPAQ